MAAKKHLSRGWLDILHCHAKAAGRKINSFDFYSTLQPGKGLGHNVGQTAEQTKISCCIQGLNSQGVEWESSSFVLHGERNNEDDGGGTESGILPANP